MAENENSLFRNNLIQRAKGNFNTLRRIVSDDPAFVLESMLLAEKYSLPQMIELVKSSLDSKSGVATQGKALLSRTIFFSALSHVKQYSPEYVSERKKSRGQTWSPNFSVDNVEGCYRIIADDGDNRVVVVAARFIDTSHQSVVNKSFLLFGETGIEMIEDDGLDEELRTSLKADEVFEPTLRTKKLPSIILLSPEDNRTIRYSVLSITGKNDLFSAIQSFVIRRISRDKFENVQFARLEDTDPKSSLIYSNYYDIVGLDQSS